MYYSTPHLRFRVSQDMSFVEKHSPADEPSSHRPCRNYAVAPLEPGQSIYIPPPPRGYETMSEQDRQEYILWAISMAHVVKITHEDLVPKKPP
jgi:hypothetical protein